MTLSTFKDGYKGFGIPNNQLLDKEFIENSSSIAKFLY